jgi:hypothetical protein
MFEIDSADASVLLAPPEVLDGNALLLQQRRALVAQTIYDMPGAGLVVIVELGAGAFQIPVVVE